MNATSTVETGNPRYRTARALTNPHAEWLEREGFLKLVQGYYGTKTLMFDRPFAEIVLEMNTGNRRVNRRKLDQLVRQMRSGEFENTGEPVILSEDGILNNGQHRLLAVVEADAVLDMDVRFGIPGKPFLRLTPEPPGPVPTSFPSKVSRLVLRFLRQFGCSSCTKRDCRRRYASMSATTKWRALSMIGLMSRKQLPRSIRLPSPKR